MAWRSAKVDNAVPISFNWNITLLKQRRVRFRRHYNAIVSCYGLSLLLLLGLHNWQTSQVVS